MILIDTNVISEVMRLTPNQRVREWMDSLNRSDIGITAISVAEIMYGIGSPESRRKSGLLHAAVDMFDVFFDNRIYAFDGRAAALYADIVIRRDNLGSPISMPDAQIAAICQVNHASLATRNTKDFENIDIQLLNPWTDF